jgi:hypothetical protein
MICEYCSKPFTPDDPVNYFLLKIGEDRKNINCCRKCHGDLLTINELTKSVKLYKISSYNFPKDSTSKKEDYTKGLPSSLRKATEDTRLLLVKDSKPSKTQRNKK